MHIAPFDNKNEPIVAAGNSTVPLNYFNIVKLKKGEAFEYQVPGFETCIVPATGTVDVDVEGVAFPALGGRGEDVWDGDPKRLFPFVEREILEFTKLYTSSEEDS